MRQVTRSLGVATASLVVATATLVTAPPAAHAAAPQTTILTGPSRPTSVASTATFRLASAPVGATFQCSLDGSAWAACGSERTVSGLRDGTHTFRARAGSTGGWDSSPAQWTWVVDTGIVPNTTVTSGAAQPATTREATFTFHSSPGGGTFQCRRDAQQWTACSSPRRESGFADGSHVFRVRARSAGGADSTPAAYHWTVDRSPVPTPPRNVNVLIVNMDDMRGAGTLQVMPKTRRWFADGGTTFTKGYVTTPDCCPSRSTLMSGRYAHNHGNRNNQTTFALDHAATIAGYLQTAGYQTGMAGRFLFDWPMATPPPFYDRWALTRSGYTDSSFETDAGPVTAAYGTTEIGRQGIRMLDSFEAQDGRPFFLYLAPYAPHTPFTAEPTYAAADVGPCVVTPSMTETDLSDKPSWVRGGGFTAAQGCDRRQQQLRTLLSADDMVEAVMNRLTALGEAGSTLAIFTSDNGYHWAEHGLTEKFSPYNESLEVPFLVRWPGKVPSGSTRTRLVGNVDVLPSVLAATGVSPRTRHPLDGRSFLTGEGLGGVSRTESFHEQFVDAYKPTFPDWATVRSHAHQYTEWYSPDGAVAFREYYDLAGDPYQLRNLLGDASSANDPDVGALATRLRGYRTCRGTTCP